MDRMTLARLTGVAYFGMIPGAIAGFLVVRPQIFDPTSAATTLAQVQAHGDLARLAVAGSMVVIVSQALAALGFYALWREEHPVAAFGVAAFGLLNDGAILAGTAAAWAALTLASGPDAAAETVQALYRVEDAAWKIGGLFFGLWLIPMGWAAMRSGEFHAGRVLGWVLAIGGVCYVLGAFLALVPAAAAAGVADLLAMPATVGEFWMIGALVAVGVRSPAQDA